MAAEVLSGWRALGPRRRECVLATVLDRAVTARAAALRWYYDPRCLMSVLAATAGRMLDGTMVPCRAGPAWVIPQLRWLHEIERLNPLGGTGIRPDDIAPPLEFGLAGLPDWPGIRIADRLSALGRHRLSMASAGEPAAGPHRAARPGRSARTSTPTWPPRPWESTRPRACPTWPAWMGAGAHGPGRAGSRSSCPGPSGSSGPAWDTDLRPAATG